MKTGRYNVDPPDTRRSPGLWAAGLLPVLFGIASVVEGGRVLFGGPDARAAAGQIVPFVLWLNFAAGFAYMGCGLMTLLRRPHAVRLAQVLAVTTLGVFAAFGAHVASGGGYERRTLVAMVIRSAFWVTLAIILPRLVGRRRAA